MRGKDTDYLGWSSPELFDTLIFGEEVYRMDPSIVLTVALSIVSLLLTIIAFFLRNLIVKFETIATSTTTNNVKIEMMGKQMEDISRMREDVAGLKYAITGYLRQMTNERHHP